MQQFGGKHREPLRFNQATRIFQVDHSLWEKVRDTRGEVEVQEFVNGVKFITHKNEDARTFYLEGREPGGTDCLRTIELIQAGEVAQLMMRQGN